MAAALTLMAKERRNVPLVQQVLFYPATDANCDTGSFHRFAEGYFVRREEPQWFWDQYTTSEDQRAEITASPLADDWVDGRQISVHVALAKPASTDKAGTSRRICR